MAARKSRKALADALKEMGRIPQDFKPEKFSNEVYGRNACIYLYMAKDLKDRRDLELELSRRGFVINSDYDPRGLVIEVSVSYFKGFHWDE